MANRLLDYIEMTEYIPSELREQLTSIRELDLQVHNAMDELERDIEKFFKNINSLSQQERQDQYDEFLKKCDVATRAASDKVKVADKLHDLVDKSMRLLDQGLEKLKEDLLEGDKASIVEELERRSLELDEAWKERLTAEEETVSHRKSRLSELRHTKVNKTNGSHHSVKSQSNHHHHPTQQNNLNNSHHLHHNLNHRNRNNSTGTQINSNNNVTKKRRERKRINSVMTIFNRNSMTEDDSTNQTFLNSPLTPDYLVGMQTPSSKTLNDAGEGDINCGLTTMKGMMAGNRNSFGISDRSNGIEPPAKAKQPILTAIDAAHAVSPNATNSDKLVLFSSNSKGDNFINPAAHNNNTEDNNTALNNRQHIYAQNQSNLLSQVGFKHSGNIQQQQALGNNSSAIVSKSGLNNNHHDQNHKTGPFSALPLSSRHDPIMMAASHAINATQNMTPGRRTSSLKASYAAVNSGRLQSSAPPIQQQTYDQTGALMYETYCKCRGNIQDPNMIACDNKDCEIEWFHYECVGITTPPEGNWYCEDCKRLPVIISSQNSNSSKQQPQQQRQPQQPQQRLA